MKNGANQTESFSTVRTITVAVPLLVIAAIAAQFTDINSHGSDTELSFTLHTGSARPPMVPPAMVVALFVPLLLLGAAVPTLRRRWAVTRGELVVVFGMLFVGIPIIGPAFWHQFPGLQLEYGRTRQMSRIMSVEPDLWPNHGNLLEGASAEHTPVPGINWTIRSAGQVLVTKAPDSDDPCVQIVHGAETDVTTVELELVRTEGHLFFQPLYRYAISARLRLDDPGPKSAALLSAGTGRDRLLEIRNIGSMWEPAQVSSETKPMVLAPDRFLISGRTDFQVPRDLDDRFFVRLTFNGSGTLRARDFRIIETEQVYRYYEGYEDAFPDTYESMSAADRVLVRLTPDDTIGWWRHMLLGNVPWRAWVRPLAIWSLLVVGLFLAMYCLVSLFFRQWNERDRLAFPLQTFLLDLTQGDDHGRLTILRSMPFWIGLGASSTYLSLQQLQVWWPQLPALRLTLDIYEVLPSGLLRDAASGARNMLVVDIRPAFVAVAFLMSLEISLSILAFVALGLVWQLAGFFTPLKTFRPGGQYGGISSFPFSNLMAAGGLFFMACHCVFAARRHLSEAAKRVWGLRGSDSQEDRSEAAGYRWTTLGLAVSAILILCFAHLAGLNPLFVTVYLLFMLLFSLSAARIRAETGIPHLMILPHNPYQLLMALGGMLALGFREFTFTAQSAFLYAGSFLMLSPVLAESMAAAARTGVPLHKLCRCMAAAFCIALVVGGVVTMSWSYSVGAANQNLSVADSHVQYRAADAAFRIAQRQISDHFRDHPHEPPIVAPEKKRQIAPVRWSAWVITAIAFALTGPIALARVIWLGFPLHPLGFALAFTPAISALWPSIAAGHVVKRLGLQFGGVQLSRNVLRPFFVGLFVGDLGMVAVWRIVGAMIGA